MSINNYNESLHKTFPFNNSLKEKIICYARNCDRIAISTLVLTVGSRHIPIHVCADCKFKFEG